MDHPSVQYAAASDGVSIAYWSIGEGPPLIMLPALPLSNLEAEWQIDGFRDWFTFLAERHRLIHYDARGTGLSDREPADLSLEGHVLDIDAVIRKTGAGKVVLFAASYAGPIAIAFAARHPERVSRLVLWCTHACHADVVAAIPQPQNTQREAVNKLAEVDWNLFIMTYLHRAVGWEAGDLARQFAELARESIQPDRFGELLGRHAAFDARPDLANLRVPTLIMHRPAFAGSTVEVAKGLAERIKDARLALLEGDSVAPFVGDATAVHRVMEEFLEAPAPAAEPTQGERGGTALSVRTILFAGGAHLPMDQLRQAARLHGGSHVTESHGGLVAAFASTQRGLECAKALQRLTPEGSAPGLLRIGLCAGEPQLREGELGGPVVEAAVAAAGRAGIGEVVASSVVRELVAGKGFTFAFHSETAVPGQDDPLRLYELVWR